MTDQTNPSAEAEKPAAASIDAPRFVGDRPRFKTLALEWPVQFDGRTYSEIVVKRLTAAEVAAFANSDDQTQFPMVDVPAAVIDALDADDAAAVNEAIADFLPRAWRMEAEPRPDMPTNTSQS